MTVMGIVLLILGALLFVASFMVGNREQDSKKSSRAMGLKLDRMIDERIEQVKGRLTDVASVAREEEEERAKRELDRLTNDKIMAIDDYSKVVLEEIERNHKEVMFLYDMLENKTTDIKNTLRKADAVKREQEDSIRESAQREEGPATVENTVQPIDDGMDSIRELLYEDKDKKSVSGMDRLKNAVNGAQGADPVPTMENDIENAGGLTEEKTDTELSRNDRVLEMKRAGMDNVDIAKSLDMGVGEVNLITDLFSNDNGEAD